VKLLLDSHVLVWWSLDDQRLGAEARRAIGKHGAAVSIASCWELSGAQAAGRLPLKSDLFHVVERNGFGLESITIEDVRAAGRLPRDHLDPFDRMLAAQARQRGMVLVTADPKVMRFGGAILTA